MVLLRYERLYRGPRIQNSGRDIKLSFQIAEVLQVLHMGLGDSLELRTQQGFFTGELYSVTFCLSLTAWDYPEEEQMK